MEGSNGYRAGRKASQLQALNHSSLNFNSFALRRPFCRPMRLTYVGAGARGRAPVGSGLVSRARPAGMCCVMVCAVWNDREGRRRTSERPAESGVVRLCVAAAPNGRRAGEHFEPFSGRYDRFATRFATLARGAIQRRLSCGADVKFPAIVIVAMVNPGMVDSGAAVAGLSVPAKWIGSAGSGALLNRGGE